MIELTLVHCFTQETAAVSVEGATKAWKLLVRWRPREMPAGIYALDLDENRLRMSERGHVLPWKCQDLAAATEVWKRKVFPERYRYPSPPLPERKP